jgi:hypothetical protein
MKILSIALMSILTISAMAVPVNQYSVYLLGQITNSNGNGISNLTVRITGCPYANPNCSPAPSVATITNPFGYYQTPDVEDGIYVIEVSGRSVGVTYYHAALIALTAPNEFDYQF